MYRLRHVLPKGKRIFTVILSGIISVSVVTTLMAEDAKAIARKAGNELRNSQRKMFSKKYEDAKSHLDKAKELFEQLKEADPNSTEVKILTGKIAKQEKDLNKRMGVTGENKTATFKLPPKPKVKGMDEGSSSLKLPPKPKVKAMDEKEAAAPAQDAGAAKKLPGGVKNRLRQVDKILQKGDRVLTKKTVASNDWKVKELENVIQTANAVMEDINKRYAADIPEGDPEMKARIDKIAEFQAKIAEFKGGVDKAKADAAGQQAQQAKQSKEWIAKLQPYVDYKKGNDKYLAASGTANEKELNKRKAIYDEIAVVFADYQKTPFPAGKSDELQQVEKKLAYAMKTFEQGYKQSLGNYLEQAEKSLDEADKWVDNKLKQNDGKTHIYPLGRDRIPSIKKMIAKAETSVGKDNPRVIALNKKVAELEKKNAKLKAIKSQNTVMIADKFKGKELSAIKAQAMAILQKKHAGVSGLRTTVISPQWKEEKVIEYTDTTRTKVRHRVTQSVSAQIAGKKDGQVCLYTIHVARNRNADGSWGPLYGNVMFVDDMLEKNVNK